MQVPRTLPGATHTPQNQSRWTEQIAQAVGGNLSYGSSMANTDKDLNLLVWKATGTSPGVADTDFTITHHLGGPGGKVPITIVGQDTSDGAVIYRGSLPWTTTTVTLRSTKANSVYNIILA